jgi:hypothetical protein
MIRGQQEKRGRQLLRPARGDQCPIQFHYIMTTKKKLELLMKQHGFELQRMTKHLVWKNHETGAIVTTSSTASDEKRFLKNVTRDIKNALITV